MAQLMPLPLTVSCFSKIQIGFTFLVPAHPGGQRAVKLLCVVGTRSFTNTIPGLSWRCGNPAKLSEHTDCTSQRTEPEGNCKPATNASAWTRTHACTHRQTATRKHHASSPYILNGRRRYNNNEHGTGNYELHVSFRIKFSVSVSIFQSKNNFLFPLFMLSLFPVCLTVHSMLLSWFFAKSIEINSFLEKRQS